MMYADKLACKRAGYTYALGLLLSGVCARTPACSGSRSCSTCTCRARMPPTRAAALCNSSGCTVLSSSTTMAYSDSALAAPAALSKDSAPSSFQRLRWLKMVCLASAEQSARHSAE
nr:MAG: hypothetical protein [Molluscum contagiosum virus]